MIIEIQGKIVNFEALSETLSISLSEIFGGLSVADDTVWVTLNDNTPENMAEMVRELVLAHDHTILSAAQQEQQYRRERLTALRANVGKTILSDAEIDALDESLRPLARKLAWLELELLALRGPIA